MKNIIKLTIEKNKEQLENEGLYNAFIREVNAKDSHGLDDWIDELPRVIEFIKDQTLYYEMLIAYWQQVVSEYTFEIHSASPKTSQLMRDRADRLKEKLGPELYEEVYRAVSDNDGVAFRQLLDKVSYKDTQTAHNLYNYFDTRHYQDLLVDASEQLTEAIMEKEELENEK